METISYLIMKVSRQLKNNFDLKLSDYDVTSSQFSVLNQIAIKNGVITAAEVAERLNSDRPTISGVINRLEDKQLLIKLQNPEDKRSAYLKLTKEALDLVLQLRSISDAITKKIFSNFSDNQIKEFEKSLLQIVDQLEGI